MAGAFTESTVIGTAGQTIERLNIPEADKLRMLNNIPVAYAVSYLDGTGFVVWFLSSLAPRLLKVNLKDESRKLEEALATGKRPEQGSSAYREWDLRAFRISEGGPAANRTVSDFERSHEPDRVFVERLRKGNSVVVPEGGTLLVPGDAVVLGARRHVMLALGGDDWARDRGPELLDFPWPQWTSSSPARIWRSTR
jgi:putative transport protein